jgi:hypothetical protein
MKSEPSAVNFSEVLGTVRETKFAIAVRVAGFFLAQTYQNGKIYQTTTNCHKLYQMGKKYSK